MTSDEQPVHPARTVLVSGGSRGLGLAIVEDLLSQHVKVATFSRTLTGRLAVLVEEYGDENLYTDAIDATDSAAAKHFIRAAEGKLGPLDGLVNNAAIGQDSLLSHTSPERIMGIIGTNLTAPLLLTREFLRRALARSGRTRIVMVTSVAAQRGYSGLVAYAAAKGGVEAAVRALARELHGRATVNAVAPGFFASEMSSVLGSDELATITRRTPSGRLVEPADLLPMIRMLLLDHTNINGQVLTIDGGSSI